MDASEAQAQTQAPQSLQFIASEIVTYWFPDETIPAVTRHALTQDIAAAIRSERERYATEAQSSRWRIFGEAAKAMCDDCCAGVKVIMLDSQIFHDVPNGIDGCDAAPIRRMIFHEMIAVQESAKR